MTVYDTDLKRVNPTLSWHELIIAKNRPQLSVGATEKYKEKLITTDSSIETSTILAGRYLPTLEKIPKNFLVVACAIFLA